VVAFDDLPEEWVADPFLTVARQPAYEIGHAAAALLFDHITGPYEPRGESVILPFELIVRRSSAPPGKGGRGRAAVPSVPGRRDRPAGAEALA
jgi:DNA-binding LacI/PurR family transcriptional regulator